MSGVFKPIQPGLGGSGALRYHELAAPTGLADAIACFWSISGAAARGFDYRIAPDGCVDLVFDLRGEGCWVYGVSDRPGLAALSGDVELFGVRIRPGRAGGLLGHPAGAIGDGVLDLSELLGPSAEGLHEALAVAQPHARASVGATVLRRWRRPPRPSERRGVAIVDAIMAAGGALPIATLAREHGCSSRQLARLCSEVGGLAPKRLARVIRLQAILRALTDSPPRSLAALALEHGYFDQAHLGAELRRMLGTSPAALRRAMSEIS